MRIMQFDEFAALPAGAIFSYIDIPERAQSALVLPHEWPIERAESGSVRGLFRKGETIVNPGATPVPTLANDFWQLDLMAKLDPGAPVLIYVADLEERNGRFDPGQVFAVYEEPDLRVIREAVEARPVPTIVAEVLGAIYREVCRQLTEFGKNLADAEAFVDQRCPTDRPGWVEVRFLVRPREGAVEIEHRDPRDAPPFDDPALIGAETFMRLVEAGWIDPDHGRLTASEKGRAILANLQLNSTPEQLARIDALTGWRISCVLDEQR